MATVRTSEGIAYNPFVVRMQRNRDYYFFVIDARNSFQAAAHSACSVFIFLLHVVASIYDYITLDVVLAVFGAYTAVVRPITITKMLSSEYCLRRIKWR